MNYEKSTINKEITRQIYLKIYPMSIITTGFCLILGAVTWHCQGLIFRPDGEELKKNLPQIGKAKFPIIRAISIQPTLLFKERPVDLTCEAEIEGADPSQVEYSWILPGEYKKSYGKKITWHPQKSISGTITCVAQNQHGCSMSGEQVEVFSEKSHRVEHKRAVFEHTKKEDLPPRIDSFSCNQDARDPFKIICQFQTHDDEDIFLQHYIDVNFGYMQKTKDHSYTYFAPNYVQKEQNIQIQAAVSDLAFTVNSKIAKFRIPSRGCTEHQYQRATISPIFSDKMPLRVSHTFRLMKDATLLNAGYLMGKWDVSASQSAAFSRILDCGMKNKFDFDGCVLGALRCKGTDPSKGDPAGDDCWPESCIQEYFRLRAMENLCAPPINVVQYAITNSGCYPDPRREAYRSACFAVRAR